MEIFNEDIWVHLMLNNEDSVPLYIWFMVTRVFLHVNIDFTYMVSKQD